MDGNQEMQGEEEKDKGSIKELRCVTYTPTPHKEYKYYALQTCTKSNGRGSRDWWIGERGKGKKELRCVLYTH